MVQSELDKHPGIVKMCLLETGCCFVEMITTTGFIEV